MYWYIVFPLEQIETERNEISKEGRNWEHWFWGSEAYKRPKKEQTFIATNNKNSKSKSQEKQNTMALKQICTSTADMTLEEFKEWLKQLDTNKDGQLSREELRQALRKRGVGWIAAFRGTRKADKNRNGVIDETEVENLIAFAKTHLGIRVWC